MFKLSSAWISVGAIHAINIVLVFPPNNNDDDYYDDHGVDDDDVT